MPPSEKAVQGLSAPGCCAASPALSTTLSLRSLHSHQWTGMFIDAEMAWCLSREGALRPVLWVCSGLSVYWSGDAQVVVLGFNVSILLV